MKNVYSVLQIVALLVLIAAPLRADDSIVPERIMGNPNAPITVQEFVSLTCSHCAHFYNDILPQLKTAYVDTGKVKFILRDFPLDGNALKAAALARCMPAEQFYPFIEVLFKSQMTWAFDPKMDPEKFLIQYAKLGGLPEDKAKACLNDKAMQDAIVAGREEYGKKYAIDATPSFIINDNAEKLQGVDTAAQFAAAFDRLGAAKQSVPVAAPTTPPAETKK